MAVCCCQAFCQQCINMVFVLQVCVYLFFITAACNQSPNNNIYNQMYGIWWWSWCLYVWVLCTFVYMFDSVNTEMCRMKGMVTWHGLFVFSLLTWLFSWLYPSLQSSAARWQGKACIKSCFVHWIIVLVQ